VQNKDNKGVSRADAGRWNAALYDRKHSFVWRYGADVIELLAPRQGERILDLGCGTGHLTSRIAQSGAFVIGMDRSWPMLLEARKNYPELMLVVGDATAFRFARPFDAVFSNAVLHWILAAEKVVECVVQALRPGGRFVLEMGAKGNIEQFRAAVHETLAQMGYAEGVSWNPKYFPTETKYSALLERHGLVVQTATTFERPTPLEGGADGLREWLRMFEKVTLDHLQPEEQDVFLGLVEERLRPTRFRGGRWIADYVRLRLLAKRV
jgi:trans-aconitate methyltransferase